MSFIAGSFLVARSTLRDPNFSQAVVLIMAHNEEGAYGLVVNRPMPAKKLPFPVFRGGPCPSPGLILLHGHADWTEAEPDQEEDSAPEVAEGVFVGDEHCLRRAAEAEPGETLRVRVFNGYSGWGPDQLEGELAAGAWAVVPATGDLLFDTPAEELWECLAPPAIPQFSVN